MNTNREGEILFYYSPLIRFKYILCGGIAMFVPALFTYLFIKNNPTNWQHVHTIFYGLPILICLEYAGWLFLKRGISGVYVKFGADYVQVNSARYLYDEIEGFCLLKKEIWGMVVYKEAFRLKPLTERLAHKYGLIATAIAFTLVLLSAFLSSSWQSNYIKLIWFALADIILIRSAITQWLNYTVYLIDINEKEKPSLSAEIADFCRHYDIILTQNFED